MIKNVTLWRKRRNTEKIKLIKKKNRDNIKKIKFLKNGTNGPP